MKRLADTKLTIAVENADPDKVLDTIRDQAKVNIVVDPAARKRWADQTVTLKLKDVSAISALAHLLRQLDLASFYADEALVVTATQTVQPHPQITIYDVRDLALMHRAPRLPPTLFGAQLDPLYYYWIRTQLGPTSGTTERRDPFWELELVDEYPPDHRIGELLAATVQELIGGKDLGLTVTYHDGYLVVVEQPKAGRLPVTPAQIKKATTEAVLK